MPKQADRYILMLSNRLVLINDTNVKLGLGYMAWILKESSGMMVLGMYEEKYEEKQNFGLCQWMGT